MWLKDNLILETITGSHAYGCATEKSDTDFVGIIMPKKEHLFPTDFGFIIGFDQLPSFKRKEMKGAKKRVLIENKEVEGEWISLIEFFYQAGIKGSPNLLEILFARKNLVTVGTKIGYLLRDNRNKFLSLRTFQSFKGYACGQMHQIRSRKPQTDERRQFIEKYGYDCKMAYHTLRLLDELEQLLTTQDLDLMRNKDECKLMRKGEWGDFNRFESEYQKRMDYLSELARKSPLSPQPAIDQLHNLLMQCIEHEYGSESKAKSYCEYISSKDVFDKLEEINKKLK